jgi:hypothetical protein
LGILLFQTLEIPKDLGLFNIFIEFLIDFLADEFGFQDPFRGFLKRHSFPRDLAGSHFPKPREALSNPPGIGRTPAPEVFFSPDFQEKGCDFCSGKSVEFHRKRPELNIYRKNVRSQSLLWESYHPDWEKTISKLFGSGVRNSGSSILQES